MGEAFCRFERMAQATRVVTEFGAARVGRAFDPRIDHHVVGRVVAHDRRTIYQRGHRIGHGLEGVDLQNDALGDVLGHFLRCREHHRDRIAEIAHDLAREYRLRDRHIAELVQHRPDRLHLGQIRRGEHHGPFGRFDPQDASRRHRAAHEAGVVLRRQIGGEPSGAAQQNRVFQPADRASDPGRGIAVLHGRASRSAR